MAGEASFGRFTEGTLSSHDQVARTLGVEILGGLYKPGEKLPVEADMLARFAIRAAPAANARHFHLLGTSGTVTTLAAMHLRLARYERRRVDGLWMSDGEVGGAIDDLLDTRLDQRADNPCIGRDRADLVLAGCAILEAIRRAFPSDRLRIADRGLREGLLMNMMREDGVWRRGGYR